MTQPTPREIRQGIREQLATMPAGADHNGRTDLDRQLDTDRAARFTEAATLMAEAPPAQVGMKPNPAQGHSSATVPAPAPTDPLAAIRAKVRTTL
jgi:hypothetical protein